MAEGWRAWSVPRDEVEDLGLAAHLGCRFVDVSAHESGPVLRRVGRWVLDHVTGIDGVREERHTAERVARCVDEAAGVEALGNDARAPDGHFAERADRQLRLACGGG